MTDQEMKRNRWIDSVRNFIFSMLGMLILFWFAGWRSSKHDLEVKIDSKADKVWVEDKFTAHEEKEKEMIQPLRNDIKIIKEYLLYGTKPTK